MSNLNVLFLNNYIFLKLSLRELRGSFNEFKIVITSIFLGVFIISAVGSLSENLKSEINKKRTELIGGKFELSTTYQAFPQNIIEWLKVNGQISQIVELRTMLTSNENSQIKRRLVELKAVDSNWPLIGKAETSPNHSLEELLFDSKGVHGVLIDKSLKKQLDIDIGDFLYLGNIKIKINGIIEKEPDRMLSFATFGSRLLITNKALNESGLIIPGSLVKHKIKFIPSDKKINLSRLNQLIKGTNITIRGIENSTNNFNNFIEKTSLFISLVGLIALLISGIGISNGVKGYLIKKIKNIAVLKSLGGRNSQVFTIYFFQIIIIFLASIIPALLAGASIPFLLSPLISSNLINLFEPSIFVKPLIISFSFGMIVCILFTIIPISQTYQIKPIQLLRLSANNNLIFYSKKIKFLILTLVCLLCFLITNLTNDFRLSFYIIASILISFLILQALTSLFFKLFKTIKFKTGSSIEIVRNSILVRNSFAKPIVISFSVGLILLITLNIIQDSLGKKITNTLNQEAPNNFLIDIQPNQIKEINLMASKSISNINLNAQPMLRGRITEINNIKVESLIVNKDVQWVLKRDRAFSWTNELPQGTELLTGKWWPHDYDGPLLVSIGHKIAKGLNINIGDKITFNILGRNFEAKVFNTREIIWENMNINFIFILSKSNLESAPHTWIATTKSKNKIENNNLIEQIVSQFSNISTISVEESYKAVKSILNLLIIIINAIAFLTLLSGVIVLSGILDVSKKDKIYEVAIFKILGANPKKISYLWLQEYFIIGLISSFISLIIGFGVSYVLVHYVFNIEFYFSFYNLIFLSLMVPIIVTIFSFLKTLKLILSKPLQVLRAYF